MARKHRSGGAAHLLRADFAKIKLHSLVGFIDTAGVISAGLETWQVDVQVKLINYKYRHKVNWGHFVLFSWKKTFSAPLLGKELLTI